MEMGSQDGWSNQWMRGQMGHFAQWYSAFYFQQFRVRMHSEHIQKGSGIARTMNGTISVNTQTRTLKKGSDRSGSGLDHGSELNLPITTNCALC